MSRDRENVLATATPRCLPASTNERGAWGPGHHGKRRLHLARGLIASGLPNSSLHATRLLVLEGSCLGRGRLENGYRGASPISCAVSDRHRGALGMKVRGRKSRPGGAPYSRQGRPRGDWRQSTVLVADSSGRGRARGFEELIGRGGGT